MMYSTFSSLATPPSPPAPSTFVQGRAVPTSSPVVRRRTGSAKGPASPLSDLPFPPSPTFTETDQMNSEEYWGVLIAPLVKQTTHRKQDYGTILSVLVSINSGNPSIIKTVDEAEEISREVGVWFIVRGSERSVVKLGIGANPGLKKYYWRAESSKRLLKREMDADPGHASLVYIIQKANTVSKRCASIPGTDLWLVMYLPATLRAAEALVQGGPASQPRKAATPTRPASPSQVVAHDVASSSSPLSPSSSSDDSSSSSDEEEFSRKRRRPTPSRPSPRSPSIVTPSVSSSSSIEIDASSIHTSKQFDAFCPMPESASSINNAVHSSSSSSDSASSPSEENLKRQCVRKADPAPLPATSTASSSSSASEDSVVPSTTSESLSIPYDINPTGDFFDSCLVTDTCPPFFLDAPSFDGPLDFPLFSPAEPDPFLPLAGSQTIFSAAIEAACMSGHRAPWMNQPLLADFLISDLSY